MLESLLELGRHTADSGYLEVIQGILRVEEEHGVHFTEALKVCKELIDKKASLERLIPDLEKKRDGIKEQIKNASGQLEKLKQDIETTRQELSGVTNRHDKEENKLKALYEKLEKETQRVDREIEQSCHKADVTMAEVSAAGNLKKEAEKHGFDIEFMFNLAKEFTGYKKSSKELSEGLKKYGALTKFLNEIENNAEEEKTRINGEITSLERSKKTIIEEKIRLTDIISELQANIKGEESMRRFYYRYANVSGLMEQLASWNQVFFIRCNNPVFMLTGAFDANSGNARFWTDKPPLMCPQCGHRQLVWDEKLYQSIGWPVGIPGKLVLGEYNG